MASTLCGQDNSIFLKRVKERMDRCAKIISCKKVLTLRCSTVPAPQAGRLRLISCGRRAGLQFAHVQVRFDDVSASANVQVPACHGVNIDGYVAATSRRPADALRLLLQL